MRLSCPQNLPIPDHSKPVSRILKTDEVIEHAQKKLFSLEQELYDEGARNFLFIDVPPMEKTPACELVASLLTLQALSAPWMPQSRRTPSHRPVRRTQNGTKYFGGTSRRFYRRMRMSRRWCCPRGTFSISFSKRLPSTVLGRGTFTSDTDLCGLIISILPVVCTNILPRGSTSSSAVNRLVRATNSTDFSAARNSDAKYHWIEVTTAA